MSRYGSILLAALFLAVLLALAAPAGAAEYDSYTKSLLHFNGSHGSTIFLDESGKVWTPHGTPQLKVDLYRFGGASAWFEGFFGGYIETPDSADFEPGAGPFTIDFWFYPERHNSNAFLLGKSGPNWNSGYDIRFYENSIMAVVNWSILICAPITLLAWHHVAVSCTADTVYLFIDGVLKGTGPRGEIAATDFPFRIGYNSPEWFGDVFEGYLDEFRFSKGIARWTANFTPPSQPYGPNGAVNLAYLHGMASANASSSEAVRALDGNWETNWAAPGPGSPDDPYWLQVDLQKSYKVDQIVLVFAQNPDFSGYNNVYNLYSSANGTDWKLIQSGTLVVSGDRDPTVYVANISLTPSPAIRYVKYEVVGGNYPWASIFELEIWGNPTPVTPPLAPTLMLLQ